MRLLHAVAMELLNPKKDNYMAFDRVMPVKEEHEHPLSKIFSDNWALKKKNNEGQTIQ